MTSLTYVAPTCRKADVNGRRAQLRGQIAFSVPFVSDAFSAQVQESVHKPNVGDIVRVVEVTQANLKV